MRPRSALVAAFAALWLSPAALAEPTALSDEEMSDVRGGIMTPLGLEVGFGADVRTYVDGELALETRLVWTDGGVVTERSGPLSSSALDATTGGWSAVVPGAGGGQTQILQDLSNGRVLAVVANTASDRTIRQEADITLVLPQLPQLQQQIAAGRLSSALGGSLTSQLASGGGGR
jgi:hypothetical protein